MSKKKKGTNSFSKHMLDSLGSNTTVLSKVRSESNESESDERDERQ